MKLLVRSLLITSLLLLPTIAFSQSQELNLKVSPSEAETVWKGLRKLPVEEVELLMGKLRQQVVDQQQPKKPVDNPPAVDGEKKEPEK